MRSVDLWVETVFQLVSVPICVRVFLFVIVPSPNCPAVFMPVAHNVPSVLIANVTMPPATIDCHPDVLPDAVGTFLSELVPSPISP
ncbi:hypothetical protein D3C86_1285430 [compost metagenome]